MRGAIRTSLLGLATAAFAATVAWAPRASAEEPIASGEPKLMSETAEITTVVDALDKDDPFDLHLSVGFAQQWKSANIRRETTLFQPGLTTGNFVARTENVAAYSETRSLLNLGAEVGLYKDLALVLRLPVILSDNRELGDLDGSTRNPERFRDPAGNTLFSAPFKAPSRSGIDWFSAGIDYAIFNQRRDPTKPTWLVGVAGRFAVGTALHACNASPAQGQPQCPDPTNPVLNRDPGISRGMHGFEARSVMSKRFGYVEPYSGLHLLVEFPRDNSDFGATNDFKGSLLNHPPLLGTFMMGLEVVPFEQREQFQRFSADLRFSGTYHSPGREYSELFDALGSSQAPSLRTPNPGGYTGTPSVVDPQKGKAYFAGITDQQPYGSFTAQTSATWQAGEYVKFQAGFSFTFAQSHLITGADACNPDFKNDVSQSGPCQTAASAAGQLGSVTGIPNPNHRAVIDLPGRRYSADDTTILALWVMGVVMF